MTPLQIKNRIKKSTAFYTQDKLLNNICLNIKTNKQYDILLDFEETIFLIDLKTKEKIEITEAQFKADYKICQRFSLNAFYTFYGLIAKIKK